MYKELKYLLAKAPEFDINNYGEMFPFKGEVHALYHFAITNIVAL